MKRFIQWLVQSSADPKNVSLTVRGALIGIIPILLFFAGQLQLGWTEADIVELIEHITVIISSFFIIVGMVRKIILKIKPLSK